MNEKIKELAVQAAKAGEDYLLDMKNNPYDFFSSRQVELEKFAELIIKECAKFLEDNSGYDDSNNSWHPEPEDLLNHFGVEE
jgi:hypothetical protein